MVLRFTLALCMLVAAGCSAAVTRAGDKCTEAGELVCGGAATVATATGTAPGIQILHCATNTYANVGSCPQSCDHVSGVRTSVGCGDQTVRAVLGARCDATGGACSMDLQQVMGCVNAVWTASQQCAGTGCGLKAGGALGCR